MSVVRPQRGIRIGTRPETQAVLDYLERMEREVVRALEKSTLDTAILVDWSLDRSAVLEQCARLTVEANEPIYCVMLSQRARMLKCATTTQDQAAWRDLAFETPIHVGLQKSGRVGDIPFPFKIHNNLGKFVSVRHKTQDLATGIIRYHTRDFSTMGEAIVCSIAHHMEIMYDHIGGDSSELEYTVSSERT